MDIVFTTFQKIGKNTRGRLELLTSIAPELYTEANLSTNTLHFFHSSSEGKALSYKIVILYIKQGFAETLQAISFQNVSFVLHRLNMSI